MLNWLKTLIVRTIMKNPKKTSAIVVSDNDFIKGSSYHLTARGNLFLMWLISQIKKGDMCDKVYKITIKDFMEQAQIKDKKFYKEVVKTLDVLTNQRLVIYYEQNREWTRVGIPWLSYLEFTQRGLVSFKFNPVLEPYLFDLKEKYTSIAFENYLELNTFSSQRIYSIFKSESFKKNATVEMGIDELKFILDIPLEEYKTFGHFKSDIILPSIKRINDHTDIQIKSYKEKKIGRKVDSIEVGIGSKNTANLPLKPSQEILNNLLFEMVIAIGFSKKQTSLILKDYGAVIVKAALEVMEEKKDTIDSPKAYFKKVLDNQKHLSEVSNSSDVKAPSPEELNLTFESEFNDCLKTLADSITHSSYKSWFSDVKFNLIDTILYVICPMKLAADRVESSYKAEILSAWNQNGYTVDTVVVSIG